MTQPKTPSASRRRFVQGLGLASLSGAAGGCAKQSDLPAPPPVQSPYQPAYFDAAEYALLVAVCDRLIPADEHGPSAAQAGVAEFIDRHMQTPYAAGDIWYMQGPFIEAAPQFGYQGRMTLREILKTGLQSLDAHCRDVANGRSFAHWESTQQDALLQALEAGKLELRNVAAKDFFGNLLAESRLGYFCDPKYGGNKGMAAWKMIGYPGARADYTDWVEVRDRPYPLPPVDQAGRRG
jgi:gluconate 2-dehydrogenase gamma chain